MYRRKNDPRFDVTDGQAKRGLTLCDAIENCDVPPFDVIEDIDNAEALQMMPVGTIVREYGGTDHFRVTSHLKTPQGPRMRIQHLKNNTLRVVVPGLYEPVQKYTTH